MILAIAEPQLPEPTIVTFSFACAKRTRHVQLHVCLRSRHQPARMFAIWHLTGFLQPLQQALLKREAELERREAELRKREAALAARLAQQPQGAAAAAAAPASGSSTTAAVLAASAAEVAAEG